MASTAEMAETERDGRWKVMRPLQQD